MENPLTIYKDRQPSRNPLCFSACSDMASTMRNHSRNVVDSLNEICGERGLVSFPYFLLGVYFTKSSYV